MILNYYKTSVSAYLESIWGYESHLATGEQLPNVLLGMGMYLIHAIIFTKETYKAVSLIKHLLSVFSFISNGGAPVQKTFTALTSFSKKWCYLCVQLSWYLLFAPTKYVFLSSVASERLKARWVVQLLQRPKGGKNDVSSGLSLMWIWKEHVFLFLCLENEEQDYNHR